MKIQNRVWNLTETPWMFEEDDGGGESGGHALGVLDGGEAEGEASESQSPSGAATEEPAPKTEPTGGIDYDKLAETFGNVIKTNFKPEAKGEEPPKQLSPEEIDQALKRWRPDEKWFEKFGNMDTQQEAVSDMLNGMYEHINTFMQAMNQRVSTQVQPIHEQLQAVQQQKIEEVWNTNYPQLAKPEIQPLVSAVTNSLIEQGKKFDSVADMHGAIATEVEKVIKATNPDFKLEAGKGSVDGKNAPNPRKIPATTPGNGGGGGTPAGGGDGSKGPKALSVLGTVKSS